MAIDSLAISTLGYVTTATLGDDPRVDVQQRTHLGFFAVGDPTVAVDVIAQADTVHSSVAIADTTPQVTAKRPT